LQTRRWGHRETEEIVAAGERDTLEKPPCIRILNSSLSLAEGNSKEWRGGIACEVQPRVGGHSSRKEGKRMTRSVPFLSNQDG